jgi:hypothetical protein
MRAAAGGEGIDRVAVWRYLQTSHVAVAQRLNTEECRSSGSIVLEGLPPQSRAFVWNILRRWKPALASLLSDDEGLRALKEAFQGVSVAIGTDDLIEAVWGYLQQQEAERAHAPQRTTRLK